MRVTSLGQVGRRTLYLAMVLIAVIALLLIAERDSGARDFPISRINGNECCGIPSSGNHNDTHGSNDDKDDHCVDGKGNDAETNKHCLDVEPSDD